MAVYGKLEEKFFEEIRSEATRRGVDPNLIEKKDILIDHSGNSIRVKWKDIEINVPAPSQGAIDNWFSENGGVIAGAVIALVGVAVGGAVTLMKRG